MKNISNIFSDTRCYQPGYAYTIIKNNRVLCTETSGWANIEKNIKIETTTPFRLASLTKQFTAVAVLLILKKYSIDIQTSINRFLDGIWSSSYTQISIWNLLTHSSGIPDYERQLYRRRKRNSDYPKNSDALDILRSISTLDFTPGSYFEYSESGYVLLARIIENITGQSYSECIEKFIIRALGLTNTFVVDSKETLDEYPIRAIGYIENKRKYAIYDDDYLNFIVGNEGIYSSLNDMTRFFNIWSTNNILTQQLRDESTKRQMAISNNVGYGFGWFNQTIQNDQILYHTGSWVGFNNCIVWNKNRNTLSVFLSNTPWSPDKQKRIRYVLRLMEKYY